MPVIAFAAAANEPHPLGQAAGLALPVAIVTLYLLPTIIARRRRVPNTGSIAVINVFTGFTLWGWIAALALACRSVPETRPRKGRLPPAGWYTDPWQPGQLRFHDGWQWTPHTATPNREGGSALAHRP